MFHGASKENPNFLQRILTFSILCTGNLKNNAILAMKCENWTSYDEKWPIFLDTLIAWNKKIPKDTKISKIGQ